LVEGFIFGSSLTQKPVFPDALPSSNWAASFGIKASD
jgi:hypothetical protein